MDETAGSVTRSIRDLETGNEAAVQLLWNRYFERLARLRSNQVACHSHNDGGVG